MKQDSFEHTIYIKATPEKVMRFLGDLQNQQKVHPLVVNVEQERSTGKVRWYRITDRLRFLGIPFRVTYRANVVKLSKDEILSEAYQSLGIQVANIIRCTREKKGTRVTETVAVAAPALLFGYTFRQAKRSHETLLARLKEHLEKKGK